MTDEDAVHWAIRRDGGALAPAEQRRFEAWLEMNPLNRGALLRAEAALMLMDVTPAAMPATAPPFRMTRRQTIWMGSAAAAVAAGVAGVELVPASRSLSTGLGEIRRTHLADASAVTMNTESRMSVDMLPEERRIVLDRGEAWFQVAHDKARPFVVSAADLRVQAVGTAFSVRRMDGGVDVLVTEGKVELWRSEAPETRVALTAGHRSFVPDDAVTIVPVSAKEGIERALAWRAGGLALAGETLDYAVSEINRYNEVQLRIDDPVLGREPIVGYFRVDDPAGFAQSVAEIEGAQVVPDGTLLRLVPKRS